MPTEPMIKNSEFLINNIYVSNAAKKVTIGIMNSTKLKKLKTDSWIIIFIGTSFPVDLRNCSTKSPIISKAAKTRKTITKEIKKFLTRYVLIFENIVFKAKDWIVKNDKS